MTALVMTRWISQVLRLLPGPLHRALDAWSQRTALKRREQRSRRAAQPK
jgi:hypothetical protein